MLAAWRIIDANFNRAREALRTAEDIARFALNSALIAQTAKALRHDMTLTIARLDASRRLANRDTPNDVGTTISTHSERTRSSLRAVAAAATSRLTEALRSLEEACKCIDPQAAVEFEQIRYRSYSFEQLLLGALPSREAPQWRVCVLLTESLCNHHPWLEVAGMAIAGGADCIQLREKHLDGGELARRGAALVELASSAGTDVIINDRVDVALLCGARGVHLGQTDLSIADTRRIAGDSLLIGISTSSIGEATAAVEGGASYCGVGPMFKTTTKDKPVLAGPEYLTEYVRQPIPLPHLAIGGITPQNAPVLVEAGCRGFAVSSCVCSSPTPDAVCQALRRLLPS